MLDDKDHIVALNLLETGFSRVSLFEYTLGVYQKGFEIGF